MRFQHLTFLMPLLGDLGIAHPLTDASAVESVAMQVSGLSSTVTPSADFPPSSANVETNIPNLLAAGLNCIPTAGFDQASSFYGLPASQASECYSQLTSAAKPLISIAAPLITPNPSLVNATVSGAQRIARDDLATTIVNGTAFVGVPASKIDSWISKATAGASIVQKKVPSAASVAETAIPTGFQQAVESVWSTKVPAKHKSGIQGFANIPAKVTSSIMMVAATQGVVTVVPEASATVMGGGA